MKQIEKCQYCGNTFAHNTAANMILYCPNCLRHMTTECEYGFGSIVPCIIYLGENEIARIILKDKYVLASDSFGFEHELAGGYENLTAYSEAQMFIEPIIRSGGSK